MVRRAKRCIGAEDDVYHMSVKRFRLLASSVGVLQFRGSIRKSKAELQEELASFRSASHPSMGIPFSIGSTLQLVMGSVKGHMAMLVTSSRDVVEGFVPLVTTHQTFGQCSKCENVSGSMIQPRLGGLGSLCLEMLQVTAVAR